MSKPQTIIRPECTTTINRLCYTMEELKSQFYAATSVIQSVFISHNEYTDEFFEVTYDE